MACPRAPVAALPITLGIVAVNKPPDDKTSSERRRQNKQKTGSKYGKRNRRRNEKRTTYVLKKVPAERTSERIDQNSHT